MNLSLKQKPVAFLCGTLLSLVGLNAYAHEHETASQISFDTEVSQSVANDEIRATLSATLQAKEAKTIASHLNQTINHALTLAKKYPQVTVVTGRQHTYPNYDQDNRMMGFTGSASLEIQSQNFEKASELVAELQNTMTLDELYFTVSDATKSRVEASLIKQVASRFQNEAKQVSTAFGAKSYKIVSVNLNNSNQYHRGAPMALAAFEAPNDKIVRQDFEPGESKISYQASGTIQLLNHEPASK